MYDDDDHDDDHDDFLADLGKWTRLSDEWKKQRDIDPKNQFRYKEDDEGYQFLAYIVPKSKKGRDWGIGSNPLRSLCFQERTNKVDSSIVVLIDDKGNPVAYSEAVKVKRSLQDIPPSSNPKDGSTYHWVDKNFEPKHQGGGSEVGETIDEIPPRRRR